LVIGGVAITTVAASIGLKVEGDRRYSPADRKNADLDFGLGMRITTTMRR
jgi:hypothetical protein